MSVHSVLSLARFFHTSLNEVVPPPFAEVAMVQSTPFQVAPSSAVLASLCKHTVAAMRVEAQPFVGPGTDLPPPLCDATGDGEPDKQR